MKEVIYIIIGFIFISFLILFTFALCIISKKSDQNLNSIESLINNNKRNSKKIQIKF